MSMDIPVAAEKLLIGLESTFATAAATAFIRHVSGSAKPKLARAEIENNGASARLFQRFTTVQGFKSEGSGVAFSVHARPPTAPLDSAATPATSVLGTPLKAILGLEQSGAGSTVIAGSTATVVNVTATHGTRFYLGAGILVGVAGVYWPTWIVGIAGDVLTVWPELPGAPAAGQAVINSYTYSLSEANGQSLTVEHTHSVPAAGSATVQRRLRGCTGEVQLMLQRGGLAQFDFDLKAASWDYGTLSIANSTVGTETLAAPIPVTQGECYLQLAGTTTRTNYPLLSLSTKLTSGMELQKVVTGGIEGVVAPARNGGRDSAEFTLRVRADVSRHTEWSAQTLLRFGAVFPSGSGTSKRMVAIRANQVQIVGTPVETEEGGFLYYDLVLRPVLDSSLVVDTAGGAPWSISLA